MVCREAGVVGMMEGSWSEAVVESDVGGGGGCCEAVVGSDVGGGCRCGWSQNNNSKRKTATSKITALLTQIIPSKQRWGNLSEHRLIGITDLGTFMVFCEFPQP